MSKPRLEWKVGLFVFIGLALLAVLVIELSKGTPFYRRTYQIVLHASNISGLKNKAGVLISGVQIGSVSDITLSPDGKRATVILRIYTKYKVYKDARFVIEQSGFLGDQYVAIVPTENKAPQFQDGESAEAEEPFNLQEIARSATGIIQRIDQMATNLTHALADVRHDVLNEQTFTNLSGAIANLRVVSERALVAVANINAMVATNGPAFAQSASNLVSFSLEIDRFATNLSFVLATNSAEITVAVKNIESSSEVLKNLLNDVQAGKGLAGNLLKNEQLASDLSQIANNLSITTSNLNRLGLWGILWKKKPPPASGASAPSRSASKNSSR